MCLYTKKQFLTDKGVIESEYADFTLKNGEPSDQNGQTCGEWRIETDPAISTDDFITFCAVPVESYGLRKRFAHFFRSTQYNIQSNFQSFKVIFGAVVRKY